MFQRQSGRLMRYSVDLLMTACACTASFSTPGWNTVEFKWLCDEKQATERRLILPKNLNVIVYDHVPSKIRSNGWLSDHQLALTRGYSTQKCTCSRRKTERRYKHNQWQHHGPVLGLRFQQEVGFSRGLNNASALHRKRIEALSICIW